MMAARYEHRTGGADNTYCTHCGTHKDNWDNQVCKLKPELTAEPLFLTVEQRLYLRDEFAKAALTGIIAAHAHPEANGYATDVPLAVKSAYEYADAMMDARDTK